MTTVAYVVEQMAAPDKGVQAQTSAKSLPIHKRTRTVVRKTFEDILMLSKLKSTSLPSQYRRSKIINLFLAKKEIGTRVVKYPNTALHYEDTKHIAS